MDYRKLWQDKNPEKRFAHRQVEFFVRRLRRAGLNKPDCQSCGISEESAKENHRTIQAHHRDYSRPLDVVWLCDSCHLITHWETEWKGQRNGKEITYLISTTVVGER